MVALYEGKGEIIIKRVAQRNSPDFKQAVETIR